MQSPGDIEIIKGAGLTEPQAKAYHLLVGKGELTPPELMEAIGETRTNAYAILDKLEKLGLARRDTKLKKLQYLPTNPVNLEKYVERRRNVILNHEYKLKSLLPQLMKSYYSVADEPAVKFYQGRDGLAQIYDDILETRQDFMLIMTPKEDDFMGEEYMAKFIANRVKKGIHVTALTPNTAEANHDPKDDEAIMFERIWYDPAAFDVPVEINIYGNKVAFLSFGQEVIGTLIESPQIAQAMRLMFGMIRTSQACLPK